MKGIAVALAGLVGSAVLAQAAPPADANPAFSDWYKTLRQPGSNYPCCSIADCRRVRYRIAENGSYEVLIEHRWYSVPNKFIVRPESNPVGSAVACYTTIFGVTIPGATEEEKHDRAEILCFIPDRPLSIRARSVSMG